MELWWILPILGGFTASVLMTDVVLRLSTHFQIIDLPDGKRKKHKKAVPLMGGLAIFLALIFATLPVLIFTDQFILGDITIWHFIGFYIGGAILMIGGFLDDKYSLSAKKIIWFPIAATIIAIIGGMGVSKITNPLGGDPLILSNVVSNIFTFVWVLGMIYTTKLLDGHDGLATGVSVIASMTIALLALSTAFYQPDVALFALIVASVFSGFWLWNAPPASIFLGESGSTFVGFTVATLAVISGSKVATALLVMGIPIFDIIFVLVERKRLGKSLFTSPDRFHLHFRLKDSGLSDWTVLGLYYALALGFGMTTLVFDSWQKLFALLILFIIMMILIGRLSQKKI